MFIILLSVHVLCFLWIYINLHKCLINCIRTVFDKNGLHVLFCTQLLQCCQWLEVLTSLVVMLRSLVMLWSAVDRATRRKSLLILQPTLLRRPQILSIETWGQNFIRLVWVIVIIIITIIIVLFVIYRRDRLHLFEDYNLSYWV